MQKKCVCCGKKLEIAFSNSKYCSSCSIYNGSLRQKLNALEKENKKWREKYKTEEEPKKKEKKI